MSDVIKDVTEASFMADVVERSREVPVVVDFWAEWCGPCRQLGPALEDAVRKRAGEIELVKVDTDSNQSLAASFDIRGIPAVKAFRDGQVVAQFTGAIPPAQIEEFLNTLVPSKADRLVEAGDESSLREALELDPRNAAAAAALGRVLLARGDADEAAELFGRFAGDFVIEGLGARIALTGANGDGADASDLGQAFASWDEGDAAAALERLQEAISGEGDAERRDLIRKVMVAIFTELGADHE
ncbi:MAG TPA: thioredoxin domain-containing protein, partial [Solirubrobacterales bacterium]|nr:thioredoxin domain-containing protein [Solirubrobacterales bacterium]